MLYIIISLVSGHIRSRNRELAMKTSLRYRFLKDLHDDLMAVMDSDPALRTFYHGFEPVHPLRTLESFRYFDFNLHLFRYLDRDYGLPLESLLSGFERLSDIMLEHTKGSGTPPFMDKEILSRNADVYKDIWYSFSSYSKSEKALCSSYDIQELLGVRYRISYTSPAGRNSYSNDRFFPFDSLIGTVRGILHKDGYGVRTRSISPKLRYEIMNRDNFTCQKCGAKGPGAGGNAELEVDHKIPFSKGGTDDSSNLWVLCRDCNRGKGNLFIDGTGRVTFKEKKE